MAIVTAPGPRGTKAFLVGAGMFADPLRGYRRIAAHGDISSLRLTWPNPEGFDPRRFLPGAGEDRHRYAYIPFGGGRRACIGMGFAQLEAVLLLAAIARRYRFDLLGTIPHPIPRVTLRPANALPMRLTRRP